MINNKGLIVEIIVYTRLRYFKGNLAHKASRGILQYFKVSFSQLLNKKRLDQANIILD